MDIDSSFKSIFSQARKTGDTVIQAEVSKIHAAYQALLEECLQLRKWAAEAGSESENSHSIVYEAPSYYKIDKVTGAKDGPFCQRCRDADEKFIRTHDIRLGTGVRRDCKVCDTKIWVEQFPQPSQEPRQDWLSSRRGY